MAKHQWKGYENSAGYGTICTQCKITVTYPGKLPTTPCPGPKSGKGK